MINIITGITMSFGVLAGFGAGVSIGAIANAWYIDRRIDWLWIILFLLNALLGACAIISAIYI